MGFPLCRVCQAGELLPMSDYGDGGADVLYKAWVCTNEACAAIIHIRKGDLFRGQAEVLSPEPSVPEPETEPAPPAKGRTWDVLQRGSGRHRQP